MGCKVLLSFIVCFILLNSFMITNTSDYFSNISATTSHSNITLNTLKNILYCDDFFWDSVYSAGLDTAYIWLPLLVFLIFYSWKNKNKLLVSLVLTIVVLGFICMRNVFMGWYLFPLITLVPMFFINSSFSFHALKQGKKSWLNNILIVCVVFNLFHLFPSIYKQVDNRFKQVYNVKFRELIEDEIRNNLTSMPQNMIELPIQYATEPSNDEFTYNLGYEKIEEPYILVIQNRYKDTMPVKNIIENPALITESIYGSNNITILHITQTNN